MHHVDKVIRDKRGFYVVCTCGEWKGRPVGTPTLALIDHKGHMEEQSVGHTE